MKLTTEVLINGEWQKFNRKKHSKSRIEKARFTQELTQKDLYKIDTIKLKYL